jgi:hypothetical protein
MKPNTNSREYSENIGVDLTKMPQDSTIMIDTEEHVYEIKVVDGRDGSVDIFGGIFIHPTRVNILFSQYKGTKVKKDFWLGKGRRVTMEFFEQGVLKRHTTSPITSGTITGPNQSWSVEIWE